MPELPEVQTTVDILNKEIKGLEIKDVWTDYNSSFYKNKDDIRNPNFFLYFKKALIGEKISEVRRRAKNVLIDLVGRKTILVHMKMTGHLMYGKYIYSNNRWLSEVKGPLSDPYNRFIHLVFFLNNKNHLVLSDTRKFAKVTLLEDCKKELSNFGPEPLEKEFTFKKFVERISLRSKGRIKNVLMDQEIISGIGNIYSDEILWASSVHPEEKVINIKKENLKNIYKNIKSILLKSIRLGGDSMSDYRNPYGEKGKFQNFHKVYRRKGEMCFLRGCKGIIERKIVGGRSAHFCNCHQKLSKIK